MADKTPPKAPSEKVFEELCGFLIPLEALSRSYRETPDTGLVPRYNLCRTCLTAQDREAPPDDWFQLGQCRSCGETLPVCDTWLAELGISLGLRPADGAGAVPRLRQPFGHMPIIPQRQLLTMLLQDIRRTAILRRSGET